MALARWNDDRLDDLHREQETTTRMLHERVLPTLRDHDRDMKRIARTGDRRSQRRWDLVLIAVGQVATIVIIHFFH